MSTKVYCSNCIFFSVCDSDPVPFGPPDFKVERCLSPNNFKDTYSAEKLFPISIPKIINKYNNCEWYEAIDSSSSSSSESA